MYYKFLSLVIPAVVFSQVAQAEPVSISKAAELALHRVERLVTLSKIDEGFLLKFKSLSIKAVPNSDDETRFISVIEQIPGADGTKNIVEIFQNEDGKGIKHNVKEGTVATVGPVWGQKDPVSLAEEASHYILEGHVTKPELIPYYNNLTGFTLEQGKNSTDETVAVVDYASTASTKILRVRVKLSGEFDSAEFIGE